MKKQDNSQVVRAYSEVAEKYADQFYKELDHKPLDRKLYDLYAEKVSGKGIHLELGCGPGEVSVYLSKHGLKMIGIDRSKEMIEIAKHLNKNIKFREGDAFNLDFGNDSIDGIIAPYLIVNFTDNEIEIAISEMYRILKKGGNLLITFHTGKNENIEIADFLKKGNYLRFKLHNLNKITKLLSNKGFIINETVVKTPYEGEKTNRAFIYAVK